MNVSASKWPVLGPHEFMYRTSIVPEVQNSETEDVTEDTGWILESQGNLALWWELI